MSTQTQHIIFNDDQIEISFSKDNGKLNIKFLNVTIPKTWKLILDNSFYQIQRFKINEIALDMRQLKTFDPKLVKWTFSVWKGKMKENGVNNFVLQLPEYQFFTRAMKLAIEEYNIEQDISIN